MNQVATPSEADQLCTFSRIGSQIPSLIITLGTRYIPYTLEEREKKVYSFMWSGSHVGQYYPFDKFIPFQHLVISSVDSKTSQFLMGQEFWKGLAGQVWFSVSLAVAVRWWLELQQEGMEHLGAGQVSLSHLQFYDFTVWSLYMGQFGFTHSFRVDCLCGG